MCQEVSPTMHLLPVAQLIETSPMKSVFGGEGGGGESFQRDVHLFIEVWNDVTLAKYLETSSSRDRIFSPFTVRKSSFSSSSAVHQPCLDLQSMCCQELGGAAQVFRRPPQLVGGWLILRP